MKIKSPILICLLIITFLLSGCKDENQENQNTINNDSKKEQVDNSKTNKKVCFRNEYAYENNSSIKDIQELTLEINEENVTGEYNWLPAEKDKREGNLMGTINNNVINAQYNFIQEGTQNTTNLEIIIDSNQAIIKGGKPELGLEATINKIECE